MAAEAPRDPRWPLHVAWIHLQRGDPSRAQPFITASLYLSADRGAALIDLAQMLEIAGQPARAGRRAVEALAMATHLEQQLEALHILRRCGSAEQLHQGAQVVLESTWPLPAERLRELVRSQKSGGPASVAREPDGEPPVLFAMGPKRVLTFGLFEFSLAVVAVVAGAVQQFDFLLDFDVWEWREWQHLLAGPGGWLLALGVVGQIIAGALAVAALLLLGLVTGLVRTILREWDFRLERTDKGLRRRRGLLTRTDVVMPIHRVQALRIGTGLVRRWFGWYRLGVVSLAQDSGGANHAAAPFAQMPEIAPIVGETGFHLPHDDADWRRGSKRYRIDRVALAALILIPLAVGCALLLDPPVWLAAVPGLGWIALVEAFRFNHDRNAIDAEQLYSRQGWLAPKLAISSRVKLQSVEIARGPIARRRGYATVHLGLAGGQASIPGITIARAEELRRAVLDSIAKRDFSELL